MLHHKKLLAVVFFILVLGSALFFQNFKTLTVYVLEKEKKANFPLNFGNANSYDDPQRKLSVSLNNEIVQEDFSAGTPGFDNMSRAYYRNGDKIMIVSNNRELVALDFKTAAKTAIQRDIFDKMVDKKGKKLGKVFDENWDHSSMVDDRIVIDDNENAYTIITPKDGSNLTNAVLLYTTGSKNICRSWKAIELKGINAALEQRDAYNDHVNPPSVLSFGDKVCVPNVNDKTKSDCKFYYDKLRLFAFNFNSNLNKLDSIFPDGLIVSNNSILTTNHSGGSNSSLSLNNNKIYVTFPSTKHPDPQSPQNGTPTYVCEVTKDSKVNFDENRDCEFLGYAGATNRLGTKVLPPDDHNIPAITVDRNGKLKVVLGAHQGIFQLFESSDPFSIANWKGPLALGEPRNGKMYGSYTYLSLLTSPGVKGDSMVLISRAEDNRAHYQLVQMIIDPDGKHQQWIDSENKKINHRVLVEPNRSFYAAYRQRMSLDKRGYIFLHFKYWPNQLNLEESKIFNLNLTDAEKVKECTYEDNGKLKYCFYNGAQMPDLFFTTLKSYDGGNNFNFFSVGDSSSKFSNK